MKKKIESKELEEYLRSSLASIKKGVDGSGFEVSGPIEFNIAVMNIKKGEGGLRIFVAGVKGGLKSEKLTHIKLKVRLSSNKK